MRSSLLFLLSIAFILNLTGCDGEKKPLAKKADNKKETTPEKPAKKQPESGTQEGQFVWDGLQNRENSLFSIKSVP